MIIGVSLPTLYISTRIRIKSARVLFVLLSAFLVVHGIYHLTYFVGDYADSGAISLGGDLFESMSYVLLFCFAVLRQEGWIE